MASTSSSSRASSSSTSSSHRRRRRSSTNESNIQNRDFIYALPDKSISEWLKCPICLNPFMEPMQASICEHIFCKECISMHLDISSKKESGIGNQHCPSCRSHITIDQLKPAASLIRNMVDSLLVKCYHEKRGCTYTCERSLLNVHAKKECGWAYVGEYEQDSESEIRAQRGRCECGKKVLRKNWHSHINSDDCSVKRMKCDYADVEGGCQQVVKESEMEEHLAICPALPLLCADCSLELPRRDMSQHEASCPEGELSCPFERFGCSWQGKRFELDQNHLIDCRLAPLETYLIKQEQDTIALRDENARLIERMAKMEEDQNRLTELVQSCIRSLGESYWDPHLLPRRDVFREDNSTELVVPIPSPHRIGRAPTSPPITLRGRSGSALAIAEPRNQSEEFSDFQLASTSAPASRADFPWQWPEASSSSQTDQATFHQQQQARTVSESIININEKVANVFDQLNQLDRKVEDSHVVGLNASFEASRAHEELNSVRHNLHALRISMIMQQQQRNMPGNNFMTGQPAPDSRGVDNNASPSALPPFPAIPGPSMMGLRRFWTGFEQTKL